MNRSGQLIATNDQYIELLINDPLYDIREDGTVWTLVTETGKISVSDTWRKCGYIKFKKGTSGEKPYIYMSYNRRRLGLHRIIYRKFVGPLEKDLVINHKDGNPTNNAPENLELSTQSENNLHRFRVLKSKPVIGNKKISNEIANEVRADRARGFTYSELIAKYKLAKSSISYICNNKTWNRGE